MNSKFGLSQIDCMILIIEDVHEIRENIAEILQLKNYEVLLANNGRTGIQSAIDSLPDLILCDILIPDINGYEIIKQLKDNQATQSIPLIFISSMSDKQSIKYAYELGASGYIIKPFDARTLINEVELTLIKKAEQNEVALTRSPLH